MFFAFFFWVACCQFFFYLRKTRFFFFANWFWFFSLLRCGETFTGLHPVTSSTIRLLGNLFLKRGNSHRVLKNVLGMLVFSRRHFSLFSDFWLDCFANFGVSLPFRQGVAKVSNRVVTYPIPLAVTAKTGFFRILRQSFAARQRSLVCSIQRRFIALFCAELFAILQLSVTSSVLEETLLGFLTTVVADRMNLHYRWVRVRKR